MNAPALPASDPVPRRLRAAVADERLPALVVDLDAVDANAEDMLRRAGGTPIRVASKSLRIPELIKHVLTKPGFQGVLAYTLPEALMLHAEGITDDIIVAYPTADDAALAELAADADARAAIAIMVDSAEQLPAVARHASEDAPLPHPGERKCQTGLPR